MWTATEVKPPIEKLDLDLRGLPRGQLVSKKCCSVWMKLRCHVHSFLKEPGARETFSFAHGADASA